MADIAFTDKSGSSNFVAGGDENHAIFTDLLLNRAELEGYLTSLRRQQYSASAPANPNTGDMWRCSTTGGSYTAGVLYRYSGIAWVQEVASALNVPNRNTVLQGAVSSVGVPTLFEAGTGLACKLNATATPCIFAFMNSNSATIGAQDIIDGIAADSAAFWSSLPANSTAYLYVDRSSGGVLSGGYTVIAPVVQTFEPAHSAGKQWVDFNKGQVWSSDGSAWTQRNRVFVGTATTNGSAVTAVAVNTYEEKFGKSLFTAAGQVPYGTGAGALAMLAAVADKHLMFNAAGDALEGASPYKIGSFTRDTSLASGTQAITGIGFKPSNILFLSAVTGSQVSLGIDNGTTGVDLNNSYLNSWGGDSFSISLYETISAYCRGKIATMDTDGFTFSWTMGGAKTGTALIYYLALR